MDPEEEAQTKQADDELPTGYRQGLITAITIFISFSLLFIKYWSLEAPGKWTIPSACAEGMIVCATVLQIITLWRAP